MIQEGLSITAHVFFMNEPPGASLIDQPSLFSILFLEIFYRIISDSELLES